jgi:hypothetical protein
VHRNQPRWRLRASTATCALTLALCAVATPARAQIEPASDEIAGTVLSIDDDEMVLDLGAGQGLSNGTSVEIWRPLRLKHPVTGRTFSDRFRLGTIVIDQVRQSLSLAHASGKLSRPAERGDIVIAAKPAPRTPVLPTPPVRIATPPPPPPPPPNPAAAARGEPPPTPPPKSTPPPPDDGARLVQAMLDALQGTDIPTRIARYHVFVDAHPNSPYSAVLREEITVLESASRAAPAASQPTGEIHEVRDGHLFVKSFAEPESVLQGRPLRLTIELTDDAHGAVLHLHKKGVEGYQSTPMRAEGPGYFGVTIPASEISDSDLEYFIDGTRDNGVSTPVLGTPDHPKVLTVVALPAPTGPRHLDATASAWTDYADYNRLRGNDRVWQTEGYFGVRLGDIGVRAVRLGFGVYRGVGGSTYDLDVLNKAPRTVGLTYGYFETEFGFVRDFSIITRGSVGLLDGGISGGGQFLFRIGNDLRTNLLLGGEFLGGVGVRSIAELNLNVFPRFPMALRTEVSDQPAGTTSSQSLVSDASQGKSGVGARGIAQIGFRVAPPILLFARASVEGRTIQHAGPGAGGGVTVSW